jgi:hypothetical protein
LTLSRGEYTEKVFERFRVQNEKLYSTPLARHFKLTKEMCPKTREEIEYMSRVPYSTAVGSLAEGLQAIQGSGIYHGPVW